MIQIKRVNKYYNRHKKNQIHVIADTTLNFDKQGLVAILGESGCGKTTLLNAIGGLDKVNNGQIFVNGKKMNGLFTHRTDKIRNLNIGYIFQDYHLIDNMSVFDNVALALKMVGIKNKQEIKKRVDFVLEAVNMYRYRNRLASNLSGGERQRVGIARALVKNPPIIIADEPTGNLDSKNTIEIMNIIKAISQTKLVILVTHEKHLAHFYASRIIELSDGKVVNDYANDHENKLDYRMDNKLYLKDYALNDHVEQNGLLVDYYHNEPSDLKIEVVLQNGNLYIKTSGIKNVEIVDEHSAIEFVDDHYQMISKEDYLKDQLDMQMIENKKPLRYASIVNPIQCLIQGFKRVNGYSTIKKVLLVGFGFAAMAMLFATSRVFGAYNYTDADFITTPHNYLTVKDHQVTLDDYQMFNTMDGVQYVVIGDGKVTLNIPLNFYYQTHNIIDQLSGTLVDIATISDTDIMYGRMPENTKEIVVDAYTIEKMFDYNEYAQQVGIHSVEDMLGIEAEVEKVGTLTIVGIVFKESPGIYMDRSMFTNMLLYAKGQGDYFIGDSMSDSTVGLVECVDYQLYVDNGSISLKKGRYPTNDYEVIIPYSQRYDYKIGKTVPYKVNDKKLKVVGYYNTSKGISEYLVSNTTVMYDLITKTENVAIYTEDKVLVIDQLHALGMNVEDPYETSKMKFLQGKEEGIMSTLIISGVMIIISLIEIFLMLRSSFLSRVKEVGVYRAIGVKKLDIYLMFLGEILAITLVCSIVGFTLMGYIIDALANMPYIGTGYVLNPEVFILSVGLYYVFNIVVGLYPLYMTLRKTPASILSRNDVD